MPNQQQQRPYLKAGDTINGLEGEVLISKDGRIYNAGYIKQLEATIEKSKAEVPVLGYRGMQYKAAGWSGSGSVTFYYVTSLFASMMKEYVKTGKDAYFDMIVTINDPNSDCGAYIARLGQCNIDSNVVALIDIDQEILENDFDFTFSDFDILSEFTDVI